MTGPNVGAKGVAMGRHGADRVRRRRVRALRPRRSLNGWQGRAGGRRWRAIRRLAAVLLVLTAGWLAARESAAAPGTDVVVASRDIPLGDPLTSADLELRRLVTIPDGAITTLADAEGQRLAAPARRGEVLTDSRLAGTGGPQPGPGRSAVAVRPADPAMTAVLQPGMAVIVVTVNADGAATVLTDDAIVLTVLPAQTGSRELTPILLSVPNGDADRVSAATLVEEIALRFSG